MVTINGKKATHCWQMHHGRGAIHKPQEGRKKDEKCKPEGATAQPEPEKVELPKL
jgi:hypothetical protein